MCLQALTYLHSYFYRQEMVVDLANRNCIYTATLTSPQFI